MLSPYLRFKNLDSTHNSSNVGNISKNSNSIIPSPSSYSLNTDKKASKTSSPIKFIKIKATQSSFLLKNSQKLPSIYLL